MQTVLVVEDESSIAELVVAMLSDAGYHLVVAANGQEALACLEVGRPDLILTDLMMPFMDGRELCKRLNSHAEYNSIPIVIMSAAYNTINLDGCDYAAFLGKPFDTEQLLETLARVSKTIGEGPAKPEYGDTQSPT
jgi:CheY-like chemotaxis protein